MTQMGSRGSSTAVPPTRGATAIRSGTSTVTYVLVCFVGFSGGLGGQTAAT
jgi:hypothetical protein